jgi:hypothetical protein
MFDFGSTRQGDPGLTDLPAQGRDPDDGGRRARRGSDAPGPGLGDGSDCEVQRSGAGCPPLCGSDPVPGQERDSVEVPINAGSAGWGQLSAAVTDMRAIAKASPAGLAMHFTVPGGVAAYSLAVLRDGLQTPLLRPGRRHLHPADHLSQPDPVAASGDFGWVGLGPRPSGRLSTRHQWPHGQRAQCRHLADSRLRGRYRLCPVPGRPLPGGAAPTRGPARGEGLCAAPGGSRDLRQRCHGDRRHAVPAGREHELHPGLGPGSPRSGSRSGSWSC